MPPLLSGSSDDGSHSPEDQIADSKNESSLDESQEVDGIQNIENNQVNASDELKVEESSSVAEQGEPGDDSEEGESEEVTSDEASDADADADGDIVMQDTNTDAVGNGDEDEDEDEDEDSEDEVDTEDEEVEKAVQEDADGKEQSDSGSESSDEEEEGDFAESGSSEDESRSADADHCMFCKQSEENDPSEEFEPYLKCVTCSNHAHHQCARKSNAAGEDEDATVWQCPTCVETKTGSESPKDVFARTRNSAPRLVRDLLPVQRGVQKPNSHSIFAQPLISDGEDGGRALRKRKSPTQEPVPGEKRRRRATSPTMTPNAETEDGRTETDRAVAHSTRRASHKSTPTARILQHRPYDKAPPYKFILAFRLDQHRIEKILSKPSRPGKRRDRRRQPRIPPPPVYIPPVPKFPALPSNHLIFPSIFSDRENELNAKPYGGILSEQEADTSRSLPQLKDREIFEIARKEAEEERRKTSAAAETEIGGDNVSAAIAKPNRTVSGPPSKIKCIQFGKYVIDTFYAAPYPEEYSHESRLFICEFCLKYLPSEFVAYRHKLKCPAKHPPGDEIYREGSISVWEVDGRKKTEYCQCLCLMAKMFLGSKTLYYDVEPFLFYILTEYDELGYHFVGYFSKEKRPASQNNVSCILVMPIHQRKGYATFLIDFSYLLTRIEGKDGSPEKPLSDMGLTAYRSYWDLTVSRHLLDMELKPFSTKTLMTKTGMSADDVIHSLERLYAFTRDPVSKTYAIRYDKKLYETIVNEFDSKKHRRLKPEKLIWTPYIMGRSDQAALDGQPMQAIAPREEDIELDGVAESQATTSAFENDETMEDGDAVSPKSKTKSSRASHRQVSLGKSPFKEDSALINDYGIVAPGPPSTDFLTAPLITENIQSQTNIDSVMGHDVSNDDLKDTVDDSLTGYALAYRNLQIPASRFQIDPPIPPSMLRSRSIKKRTQSGASGKKLVNGGSDSTGPLAAVRSSPRNANSSNNSINGTNGTSRGVSPDKVETPIRRSGRKSGLANVEVPSLDGTNDDESESESESGDELAEEIRPAPDTDTNVDGEEDSSSAEQVSAEEDEDDDEDDEQQEEEDGEESEETDTDTSVDAKAEANNGITMESSEVEDDDDSVAVMVAGLLAKGSDGDREEHNSTDDEEESEAAEEESESSEDDEDADAEVDEAEDEAEEGDEEEEDDD